MRMRAVRVAELIKLKRKELDLTQQELTTKLGWSNKNSMFLSNIERNKCTLPAKHINKMCEAINVDKNYLIGLMLEDYRSELMKESSGS